MPMLRVFNPFVVLALGLFIATGCNAFEFMYSDDSDDPEVLFDDAQIALQNGDTEKAIDLLEKALEMDPENPEIKIELTSALFQGSEIDLLVMKDLAEFISETPASASKGFIKASVMSMPTCNFGDGITSTELDLTQDPAYQLLSDKEDVLARALELLYNTLETEEAANLHANILSNAHLMRAISNMAVSIIEIKEKADEAQATLHRLSNGSIGYCAADQEALEELESFIMCDKLPAIDQAVDDLVSRQTLFSDDDSDLAEALADARAEITGAINVECSI